MYVLILQGGQTTHEMSVPPPATATQQGGMFSTPSAPSLVEARSDPGKGVESNEQNAAQQ